MNTFEGVNHYVIPAALAAETDTWLREAGRDRVERFVLWTGVIEGDVFRVRTAHAPKQTAFKLETGLCVRVDSEELHRLNVWLFENGERLAIQVHSHPTEAYHSDTDDSFPIVTTRGGLSLVVPDFGRRGVRGEGVAWYRLFDARWEELESTYVKDLVEFED